MLRLDRRSAILGLASIGLLPTPAFGIPSKRHFLPSPIFPDADKINLKYAEGYRPYRPAGYVSRGEALGERYLFHSYGHGGAGITMSWGIAQLTLEKLHTAGVITDGMKIAVIGSGAIGMTTASVLADANMDVTVYSRETFERTTSHVAGGQFAPADVVFSDATEFEKVLATAYAEHSRRGEKFGVQPKTNYTLKPSENLLRAVIASGKPLDMNDPARHSMFKLDRLPFEHMNVGGYSYPTILVEPPIFLERLHSDLVDRGVKFRYLNVLNRDSLSGVVEPLIINCLGAGAQALAPDDTSLSPAHGIIAVLPPQPALDYLFSGIGYFFPRKKDLVIGGSFETGAETGRLTSQDKARLMVKIARAVFEGALPAPGWLAGKDQTLYDSMLRSPVDD